MFFFPFSVFFLFLLLFLVPLVLLLIQSQVISFAFLKLGLTPFQGFLFFTLCLMGSGMNIPVKKYSTRVLEVDYPESLLFYRFIPRVNHRILALNMGGAVMPLLLCLRLLLMLPIPVTILLTVLIALITYKLARPTPGIGIKVPVFLPPLLSSLFAILLAPPDTAPQVAYFSGTVGTLLGADLFHLKDILKDKRAGIISIGGAGIFDGIFLIGIFSVLLA